MDEPILYFNMLESNIGKADLGKSIFLIPFKGEKNAVESSSYTEKCFYTLVQVDLQPVLGIYGAT